MYRRRHVIAVAAVLTAGLVAGRAQATPPPTVPDQLMLDYLDIIDNGTELADLDGVVAAGSTAAHYAVHRINMERVFVGVGEPTADARAEVTGPAEAANCYLLDAGQENCGTFGFTVDDAGLIIDITVDGVPVADRLGSAGAPAVTDGVTATVASSYRSAQLNDAGAHDFQVVVELAAGDAPVVIADTIYQGPERLSYAPVRFAGPNAADEGSTVQLLFVFRDTAPGGTLEIDFEAGGETLEIATAVPRFKPPR